MYSEKEIISRVTTSQGDLQLQRWMASGDPDEVIYEIIFNGVFLMASYNIYSSEAAATLALEPLRGNPRNTRALIGGLGIGYTLRAALADTSIVSVDVVEIENHIVQWAKTYFVELNNHALADPRTKIIEADLKDFVRETQNRYDAIIFDVDNGPGWLTLDSNRDLYNTPMLKRIRNLLTDDGVFTVWAAQESQDFHGRLEDVFTTAEVITIQEMDRRKKLIDYYIYRAYS